MSCLAGTGGTRASIALAHQETKNSFPQSDMWSVHHTREQRLCLDLPHTGAPRWRGRRVLHKPGGEENLCCNWEAVYIAVCVCGFFLISYWNPVFLLGLVFSPSLCQTGKSFLDWGTVYWLWQLTKWCCMTPAYSTAMNPLWHTRYYLIIGLSNMTIIIHIMMNCKLFQ